MSHGWMTVNKVTDSRKKTKIFAGIPFDDKKQLVDCKKLS